MSSEAVMAIEALFLLINSGTKAKQSSNLVLKVRFYFKFYLNRV